MGRGKRLEIATDTKLIQALEVGGFGGGGVLADVPACGTSDVLKLQGLERRKASTLKFAS